MRNVIYEKKMICDKAELTTYVNIPNNKQKRPALIICPGGGYVDTSTHEGECVALEFISQGFQCFVLDYSTLKHNPQNCQYPQSLIELSKTIDLIKKNHEKWYIDIERVFLLGVSAGGNLIANYGNNYEKFSTMLNIPIEILRPTGLVLCYPVLKWKTEIEDLINYKSEVDMQRVTGENIKRSTGEFHAHQSNIALFNTKTPTDEQLKKVSPCYHISEKTPPTFIWHTFLDDMVSVKQIYEYVILLNQNQVSHELHIFESGHHGFS